MCSKNKQQPYTILNGHMYMTHMISFLHCYDIVYFYLLLRYWNNNLYNPLQIYIIMNFRQKDSELLYATYFM